MTEQEVLQIEETFSVDLPKPYRDFLLSYPDSLCSTGASGWDVLNDPQRIIEINQLERTTASSQISKQSSTLPLLGEEYVMDKNSFENGWCQDIIPQRTVSSKDRRSSMTLTISHEHSSIVEVYQVQYQVSLAGTVPVTVWARRLSLTALTIQPSSTLQRKPTL